MRNDQRPPDSRSGGRRDASWADSNSTRVGQPRADRRYPNRQTAANITASWFADLLREVEATQADQRAAEFDAAAHHPGDYPGRSTPAQLDAQAARCRTVAHAFRAKASVLREGA